MNPEQVLAAEDVIRGNNVFITGGAGVGKSFLVNEIVKYAAMARKIIGVCAMTGCAALLINGTTLHSYLGIGLAKDSPEKLAAKVRNIPPLYERILEVDILLVDEVSMMSDDLFEKVDKFMKIVRRNSKPFGDTQMVMVGDPFQLCPVEGNYCFTSPWWKDCNFKVHCLTMNMRQKGDQKFKDLLDRVRWGVCSNEDYEVLKGLKNTVFPDGIKPTKLYSKNVSVDSINNAEMQKLGAEIHEFTTTYLNDKSKKWAETNRVPEKVRLCIGAQVMCTRNQPALGLANGSRGIITAIDTSGVMFKKMDGEVVRVSFIALAPPENKLIQVTFLPIKLAWAITIHSAQGMTIDALEVDLGTDIFAFGQAYTGLSRATSLATVRVPRVLQSSFVTSDVVKNFIGTSRGTPLMIEGPSEVD